MAIIRRTIKTSLAKALFMDANRQIEERDFNIPANVKTPEQAEKWYRKNFNGKLIEVEEIVTLEKLFGMDEELFVMKATAYEQRSKETRDLITKNVKVHSAKCLVMTSDRKVKEVFYANVRNEKQARARAAVCGDKFIEIIELSEDEILYGISYADFINNAKPMVDDFHFAD